MTKKLSYNYEPLVTDIEAADKSVDAADMKKVSNADMEQIEDLHDAARKLVHTTELALEAYEDAH